MNRRSVSIGLIVFSSVCSAQFARKDNETDDKQAEREEWFYTQRAYPHSRIPVGARLKGLAEIERMDRLRLQNLTGNAEEPRALTVGSWTSIGPQPTSAGTIFVTAGRVNSIAIDPRNSKTIYV